MYDRSVSFSLDTKSGQQPFYPKEGCLGTWGTIVLLPGYQGNWARQCNQRSAWNPIGADPMGPRKKLSSSFPAAGSPGQLATVWGWLWSSGLLILNFCYCTIFICNIIQKVTTQTAPTAKHSSVSVPPFFKLVDEHVCRDRIQGFAHFELQYISHFPLI